MAFSLDCSICTACGTQFIDSNGAHLKSCRICNDPRQFVPPSGQSFTTLRDLRAGEHHNIWEQDEHDERIHCVSTEPKFGIGQRAFLLQTEHGNVLWDLIALIDKSTIEKIKSFGGLSAIVISHPHFYTTVQEWAWAFNCPVYTSAEDGPWIEPGFCSDPNHRFLKSRAQEVLPGVMAIRVGGHFDGSLVLHWNEKLFIADTFVTVPSAHTPYPRPPGQTSYSFMWSIPNMIPLPARTVADMWKTLMPYKFKSTHGAFAGMDVRDDNVKSRVRESAEIQIKAMGDNLELND